MAAATTNSTLIKTGPGEIEGFVLTNTSAAVKYVKLYDKATAPVVGTDIPILTIAIPVTSSIVLSDRNRVEFENGLGLGITTLGLDTDTTAVVANDVIAQIFYK